MTRHPQLQNTDMPRPGNKGTRYRKRIKGQETGASRSTNSKSDGSTEQGIVLGNDSILGQITQHLTSDGASSSLDSTAKKSASSSPISSIENSLSSSISDSTQSSDTLITDLSDNSNHLDIVSRKRHGDDTDTDKQSFPDGIYKISDLDAKPNDHKPEPIRLHVVNVNMERKRETDASLDENHDTDDLSGGRQQSESSTDKFQARDRKYKRAAQKRREKKSSTPSMPIDSQVTSPVKSPTMPPTINDSALERIDQPKTVVEVPPASLVTAKRVSYPRGYCRDWQKGNCTRRACKYLHAPLTPEGSQSVSPVTDPTVAGGSTGDIKVHEPASRKGFCWNWQRGKCTKGDKCRFKHFGLSQGMNNDPASSSSPKAPNLNASFSPDEKHPSGDPNTGFSSTRLPVKEGCTFCLLGLCIDAHRTPESFLLADSTNSRVSRPNGLSRLNVNVSSEASLMGVKRNPNTSNSNLGSKQRLSKEFSGPEELSLTLLKSTRVTLGRGLQVLDVSTAFESNIIQLGGLPAVISESDLRSIGAPFGEVISVEHVRSQPASLGSLAKIVYSSHSEAASAIIALNGSMQFFSKITARPFQRTSSRETGRLSACIVRVDIPAPGMTAFAGYETMEEAEKVIKVMHGSTFKKHVVAAHMHRGLPKLGPFTVIFEGVPHHTTDKLVRKFGFDKEKPTVKAGEVMMQRGSYQSLADVTTVLHNIFEDYGDLINLDLARSIPTNGRIRGIARFANAEDAAAVCEALNGRRFAFLGSERIYLQHLHKMTYKIPGAIYSALGSEMLRLASFARGQPGVQLTFNETLSGDVEIDLNASHIDSLKRVKAPLERLIAGEMLAELDKPVWHNFFSTASGFSFIDSVSKLTKAHIRPNNIRCFVKLWGTQEAVAEAKTCLLNEVSRLRAAKSYVLPLEGKVLMQVLFNKLDVVRKELGEVAVMEDFKTRSLVIRGTEEQFRSVVNSLSMESVTIHEDVRGKNNGVDGRATCPICLDAVAEDIILECGHSVCKECLIQYLISACDHKTFPLKCLGNENQCTELLPLPLCQRLLQKEQFARLVEASFFTYIQTRPQEFHYCPTPDCPQIYRDAPGTILQCPSCLVRICPTCHEVQHDGVECRVTSEAGERLFNEWREQHNVKTCPSCSANIEKIAGCNHLTCTSCNTHICWECLKTFRASKEVYDHMIQTHRGIGL